MLRAYSVEVNKPAIVADALNLFYQKKGTNRNNQTTRLADRNKRRSRKELSNLKPFLKSCG